MGAVQGRCDVYMDGGIRRGTDILKALALGAKAVFIGRPVLWGLACQVKHHTHLQSHQSQSESPSPTRSDTMTSDTSECLGFTAPSFELFPAFACDGQKLKN